MNDTIHVRDMRIIGLIGAKGAGKTTAYNIISDMVLTNEIMIARKLKTVCADILCMDEEIFSDPIGKERPFEMAHILTTGDLGYILRKFNLLGHLPMVIAKHNGTVLLSPRHAAQYIGTEILRDIDHRVHVRGAISGIDTGRFNVVTDIRFQDEYEAFKSLTPGFKLYYIQRDVAEREAARDTHVSEANLAKLRRFADVTVYNNGDMAELQLTLQSHFGA